MMVTITSKTIEIQDRTAKVEILMKSEDEKTIYAVLWISVIYFNVKTRKSERQPEDIKYLFKKYAVDLEQKNFEARSKYLRTQNAINS
jgi:acyl-CoA thioester hydrolase